jgi:DNA-binding Lrp family transcriptional regulator
LPLIPARLPFGHCQPDLEIGLAFSPENVISGIKPKRGLAHSQAQTSPCGISKRDRRPIGKSDGEEEGTNANVPQITSCFNDYTARGRAMSNKAIKLARAVRTVRAGARQQLMLLADHANEDFEAWPSQQKLADDQGVSLDTVQRRNAELEVAGLITRRSRYPNGKKGRLPDGYKLNRHNMELAAEHGSTPQDAAEQVSTPQNAAKMSRGLHRNLPGSTPQSCGVHKEPSLEPSGAYSGKGKCMSLLRFRLARMDPEIPLGRRLDQATKFGLPSYSAWQRYFEDRGWPWTVTTHPQDPTRAGWFFDSELPPAVIAAAAWAGW